MAKIISVELEAIPEVIHVGDDISDIIVSSKIYFHNLDLKLEMDYCLHLFVYDINGKIDTPIIIPNWDESKLTPISTDRNDEFLGQAVVKLVAKEQEVIIKTPISLKLGKIKKNGSYFTRKLEVFATIAPAVGRASKWSGPFEATLVY